MKEKLKEIVYKSINGDVLTDEDGLFILNYPDEKVEEIVDEVKRIREEFYKNEVEFCSLINAKNGGCSEDCSFCAQSSKYPTPINAYPLVSKKELLEGAEKAVSIKANRYCIVTSGRRATEEEVEKIAEAVKEIREKYPVRVCVSLGSIDKKALEKLKEAGVERVNHNLETSERFFPKIVSTHPWKERYETIKNIQEVGLSTCTGGIFGLGETDKDIVDLAKTYRELGVDSIPLNFLIPIPGTPLENSKKLTPERCLKIIAVFKVFNPESEIRLCGGREQNLGKYHDLAMEIANCLMAGGYLTRAGRAPGKDEEMVNRLNRKLITKGESFSYKKELSFKQG